MCVPMDTGLSGVSMFVRRSDFALEDWCFHEGFWKGWKTVVETTDSHGYASVNFRDGSRCGSQSFQCHVPFLSHGADKLGSHFRLVILWSVPLLSMLHSEDDEAQRSSGQYEKHGVYCRILYEKGK